MTTDGVIVILIWWVAIITIVLVSLVVSRTNVR